MEENKISLIAVVGPTASGKSELGICIAEKISGEIVSADSMQIYKGINIASAAPTTEECRNIPHYMLGFLEPVKEYSVADYVTDASAVIADIYKRGKQPILVGGTGLYINSLTGGITFEKHAVNTELRANLEDEYDIIGGEKMLEKLSLFDKCAADALNPADKRRIVRAFEIYEATGITKTQQDLNSKNARSPYKTVFIGINFKNREKLYERINRRVDIMLENGLIAEAESMLKLQEGTAAAQAIGHKELYAYLRGEKSLEDSVEDLKRATRRYAKRQLTWFRKNENINWIYADECDDIVSAAMDIIKKEL